jgi:hypothetical protein
MNTNQTETEATEQDDTNTQGRFALPPNSNWETPSSASPSSAQPPSPTPLKSRTQPEQIPNEPRTDAEQTPNTSRTNTEQTPNSSQTKMANPASANPEPHFIRQSEIRNPQSPDPDLAAIEEEIIERTQSKSPLDMLPITQQELLYDLLSRYTYRKVKDVIALPPPRGLNITPSLGALFDFKRRYAKRSQLQKKKEVGLLALELLNEPPVADDGYAQASERLLRLRLLETINNPASKTSEIRDLFQTLVRLRAQTVSEKRLKLAERKQSA